MSSDSPQSRGPAQQQAADLVGCAHSSVSDWENEVTRNVGADNPSKPSVKRPRGRKTKLSLTDKQEIVRAVKIDATPQAVVAANFEMFGQ
jgi:hypothetical protein